MACLKGTQVDSVASTIGCDYDFWGARNGSQAVPLSAVWKSLKHLLCSPGRSVSYPGASSDRKMLAERENMLFYRFLRHFCCTAAGEGTHHDGRSMRRCVPSKTAEWYACFIWSTYSGLLRGPGLNWSQEELIWKSVGIFDACNGGIRSLLRLFDRTLQLRRFFTTPNQDFGLCPKHAQEGDIVVILDGGKVPYILRERPYPLEMTRSERLRAGPTYRFIGECYVETYMDGSEADKAGTADDDPGRHKYYRKVFKIT